VLSAAGSLYVVISIVFSSLAFLFMLNRVWPPQKRRNHNSVFAWQFNFLGTAYGVIISFMLFTAWTDFAAADLNTDAEANALVNLSRIANALPNETKVAVQSLTRRYSEVMLTEEWPAMAQHNVSQDSHEVIQQLWATLTHTQELSPTQQVSLDHSLTELSNLTEHRRIRQLQMRQQLPIMLWVILVFGSVLTISYACLFGAESLVVHALQVFGLSLLIAVCLVAIADLSRPYQGASHIKPYAFMRASQTLQQQSGQR
jgi:hypothetical protein